MCTTGILPTQRPSARSCNSTHRRADKKHCLSKPGLKNDDLVSSQACVGQTSLPLKVLHSSCFRERSGGLFCSLLCQHSMEQAFKCWVSSLHKRLWAKQSRDEQGQGLRGPEWSLTCNKGKPELAGHRSVGLGGEVCFHGDGSAPAPEASARDPRCKVRFLRRRGGKFRENSHRFVGFPCFV